MVRSKAENACLNTVNTQRVIVYCSCTGCAARDVRSGMSIYKVVIGRVCQFHARLRSLDCLHRDNMDEEDINALVNNRVKDVIQESHGNLLREIGGLIDKISYPSSSASSSSISSLDAPKFKRKSNEEQFKQNSKVIARLEHAELNMDSQRITEAKNDIIEGRQMIASFKCKGFRV